MGNKIVTRQIAVMHHHFQLLISVLILFAEPTQD